MEGSGLVHGMHRVHGADLERADREESGVGVKGGVAR